MKSDDRKYLGDGCYAEFDGQDLVLTTSNGFVDTNRIVLEWETWRSLVLFMTKTDPQSEALRRRPDQEAK